MPFSSIKGKIVFITGSKKNCGKTTLLNYFLSAVSLKNPGYLSIGLDGEKNDQLTGALKPYIIARENDILLTNTASIRNTDASFRIINVYNFSNSQSRPVLLRILRSGRVEISGPGENSRLTDVIKDMKKAGAETILVDGAFDRITQIAAAEERNFFYVARVDPEYMLSTASTVSLLFSTMKIPVIKENRRFFEGLEGDYIRHGETLFMRGAVTPSKLEKTARDVKALVFEDMTKIFLDYSQWKALTRKYHVFFTVGTNLISFVINLYNVSRKEFEDCVAEKDALRFFVYNPYECR